MIQLIAWSRWFQRIITSKFSMSLTLNYKAGEVNTAHGIKRILRSLMTAVNQIELEPEAS